MNIEEIAKALRVTLEKAAADEGRDPTAWGFGYYGDEPSGWIDCQIEQLAEALLNAGWTPPVVLPVPVEWRQG